MKLVKIKLLYFFLLLFTWNCSAPLNRTKSPIKVIIFADKSGSIIKNNIPKLEKKHFDRLFDYVKENGGEIALSNITDISKDKLSIIRNVPKPVLAQGENADEFSLRIREWKNNSLKFNPEQFFGDSKVKEVLDYSKLYDSSNVADAIDLANIYLGSKDFFGTSCRKIAIFITDGENNVEGYLPNSFCCEIYMVTRSSNIGILKKFSPSVHPRIEESIDEIINK